jgi:two-component system CheB/CheR fusion protein
MLDVTLAPPLRILVTDDCQDLLAALDTLLRLWGHEPLLACDGPCALKLAADCSPDVVFLDTGLPGMDGHEVARRLRLLPGLERALVIALSGYGLEEDQRLSLEAGCDLHWVKPVEPGTLERLLSLCRARRA